MSNKIKREALTRADVIKCHLLMQEHLHKIDGSDLWKYDEGWDDQRIVAEVGGSSGPTKVSNLRLELFGKLQTKVFGAPAVDLGPIEKQLHELESKLHKLDHALGKAEHSATKEGVFLLDFADRFNRLIDLLKMNHICDARNIKVEIPK